MKKIAVVFCAIILVVVLGACSSMQPVMTDTSFHDGCEVLGRVTIEVADNNAGFAMLLEEAKKVYPEADDVVNIIVDTKTTNLFFYTLSRKYYMSGIAVNYN